MFDSLRHYLTRISSYCHDRVVTYNRMSPSVLTLFCAVDCHITDHTVSLSAVQQLGTLYLQPLVIVFITVLFLQPCQDSIIYQGL